ncbi:MAG: hypothetical protein GY752_08920 [bacterium]|nr:hypothetical protein [bacterium]
MNDKTVDDDLSKDKQKTEEEMNELDTFKERPKTLREEAMEIMVQNSADEREKSRQELIDDMGYDPMALEEDEEELEEDEEVIEPDIEEELDKPVESANTPIIERDGKQFMQLKVDGQLTEMPIDAVQAAMQKAENTDQRMWEADQTKQKYETLIAQHDQAATLPDASSEDVVDTQETLKEALTKVYDGEVDEAAEVLGKVFPPSTPAISEEEIDKRVDQRVAARDDLKTLQLAFKNFKDNDEFKQITSDPVLLERVNTFTEDLQRDPEFMKTNPTYDDFFKEAGKRTQAGVEKISGKKPAPAPTDENDVDSRLKRKRLTPSQPASRTVRRGRKPEEKSFAKSRGDVIKEMAERRGQTNL